MHYVYRDSRILASLVLLAVAILYTPIAFILWNGETERLSVGDSDLRVVTDGSRFFVYRQDEPDVLARAKPIFGDRVQFKSIPLGYAYGRIVDFGPPRPFAIRTRTKIMLGAMVPLENRRIQLVTAPETFGSVPPDRTPTDEERAKLLDAFADYVAMKFPELHAADRVRRGVFIWDEIGLGAFVVAGIGAALWIGAFSLRLWARLRPLPAASASNQGTPP